MVIKTTPGEVATIAFDTYGCIIASDRQDTTPKTLGRLGSQLYGISRSFLNFSNNSKKLSSVG